MRTMLLAAVTAAFCSATLAAQEVRRVTLAEALDLSLRAQPAMVQARQAVRQAAAEERQRTAQFLPSVNSNASTRKSGGARINQFGVPTQVESFFSSSVGLSASWEVFTGFRRGAQRSAARATSDQRYATLRRQEYATALATKRAFFTARATAELVSVRQTSLRRADEQMKLTVERLRLGATTRSDSLRARVVYGNAQLALIEAQNALRDAQAGLGRTIQMDGLAEPIYDSTLEARVQVVDTAALMGEAMERAPSIREADAAVASAQAQKGVARAAYLPTVSLGSGYTWAAGNGTTFIRDSVSNLIVDTIAPTVRPFAGRYLSGWNVSLTVSYPLFNNLTRETNAIAADAGLENALAQARDARLALAASLTTALAALDAAAARIDVSSVSVRAAEEDLRLQRERYRLGAATIIEVLQSQESLDQAQVDLVQARYDYLVARAEVEALVGRSL